MPWHNGWPQTGASRQIGELIRDFEAEHGVITEDEIAEQARIDRDAAAALRMAARQVG